MQIKSLESLRTKICRFKKEKRSKLEIQKLQQEYDKIWQTAKEKVQDMKMNWSKDC